MNLFQDQVFSYHAQPIPKRLQKLFEHVRKEEFDSAMLELDAIRKALDKVQEFVSDEL